MAQGKKANEIDKLTVATFENWKLSEIFNEAVPCETYTAAELLFHPEQADPRYVAEHYVAFQRYCEQQGYTEPVLFGSHLSISTSLSIRYATRSDVFILQYC